MPKKTTALNAQEIRDAVQHFVDHQDLFDGFARSLLRFFHEDPELGPCIHFSKHRLKNPKGLGLKLARKAAEGKRITKDTLFEKVTDLVGARIIHLHTSQVPKIHAAILRILAREKLSLVENPTANCWDVDYEGIYRGFGLETRSRESMYTTIHYVVRMNQRTMVACELQVRTLMDEVWGEVSHRVDYPSPTDNEACQNQLKVLARLTTGCTRLVDSIFASKDAGEDIRAARSTLKGLGSSRKLRRRSR